MQILHTLHELHSYLEDCRRHRDSRSSHPLSVHPPSVGLVPTMGALHAGHQSLIERSRQTDQIVIVSIFVNPLQFSPDEDLERYPRSDQADKSLCQAAGVDAIFMPTVAELYGTPTLDFAKVTQVVPPTALAAHLEGRSRPTHFRGVATVVTKLLNLVRPTRAYFGQKDAQQAAIIKQLQQDLNLPGEIVICPIVREPDGLALSSRNRYLTDSQRQQATVLSRSLRAAKSRFSRGERTAAELIRRAKSVLATEPKIALDYLALVHPDTLEPLQVIDTVGMMAIAATVGTPEENLTRLLDNIILCDRQPIIAIDGPAGAGKSTVARQIAHSLGLLYLDTGAMYRALTWYALQRGVDLKDEEAIAQLLPQCKIQLIANIEDNQPQPPQVRVNGEDATQAIRTPIVTESVSTIAAQPAVRSHLVGLQQQYGEKGGVVADGRDIGTKVFPDAELKIYLTASVEERAQRRYQDLENAQSGNDQSEEAQSENIQSLPKLAELTQAIVERDRKDSTRSVSPLRKAEDAIEIFTDHLTAEQVIAKISNLYQDL
ncbi:bifunctional pantoate--beta-alanine ligase/(d)CMP kinase [cf. Phormidesmis sp. LEGE 11477]|uniref:bifunctional pantoate--beta-alanine ligase/(d)CMP kinase n=1 Tax=cf. Phormidesmis sp. LEGE 11477 TaxID=1828680 RepID=UPI00187FA266|nr:bifunctional pantoate--beta-alanine ligase/(d)CMP kinase [cf. Phormidesmis sp. LEGE 11477]